MKKVFIRFPSSGKNLTFKTGLSLKVDDHVLVEIEQIIEEAYVVTSPEITEETEGQILRRTSDDDREVLAGLKVKARSFLPEAQKKVTRHGLNMRILDADLSFDQKKLTFYFCSPARIDFRSLVSDMVRSYNKIIRLQQVGARDEAKYFGGIGKCGRELCCAKFLKNLESITLEMAQTQELATAGSAKLSGCCGKLMCCLSFEVENYTELKEKMPKIGSLYKSKEGEGKVISHNVLEGKIAIEQKSGKKIEVKI